jgi:mannan endo-1,4-beta-mannosidase
MSLSQMSHFVTRSGSKLHLEGRPFYFLGANAYYLTEVAARGDTNTVKDVFASASQLGMTVVRTWAFFDSSDSLNPAVIQWRPGMFNEQALRALDFVIWQSQQNGMRLLLPLVNNWDDYGGMNQYVRWRMQQAGDEPPHATARYTQSDIEKTVEGSNGRRYRVALSETFGHDDFYVDLTIRGWFKSYVTFLVQRVNTFSGLIYKDDPAILGWEIANEPRSSDRSGHIVTRWMDEISAFLKQIDTNHLVGTGEEGFDNSIVGYSLQSYHNQGWLFDGTAGISFSANSTLRCVDFASIHLYPQSWGLPNSTGNSWISDHIRLAAIAGKPLVLGEFGVLAQHSATYDSWLTTVLLDDGGGAMVWQLLGGTRNINDGYGIRCPDAGSVCNVLRNDGERFNVKSISGTLIPPPSFSLFQNYPNPFNGQTTIAYDLPADSYVNLSLFNSIGEIVTTLVEGFQRAGTRKELLEVGSLASGAYFYRASAHAVAGQEASATNKLIILK